MTRKFSHQLPHVGGKLPANSFGRLVGQFQFASHIPLRGGKDTGRHIYLALKVPGGTFAGNYEAAVNIRSDEGTVVKYADRLEDLGGGGLPEPGFQKGVNLAYGTGADASDPTFMGLKDGDFQDIVNDDLYNKIADLSQGCDLIAVYGVTYSGGDGIHDVHMNSGTEAEDPHAKDDRERQDGAIAFYFNLQAGDQQQKFARWIFIKFASQSVVNYS